MQQEVLRMHDVTLVTQGSVQLQNFSLSIRAGEIVGMLQMQGHGVTAMLDLLQHNLPLQSGYVYYQERQVNSWQSRDGGNNRIAVIRKKSALVPNLTVADNILVLRPGFRMWTIRTSMLNSQVQPVLDELGVNISADDDVGALTSFEKMVVELVRAVMNGCQLIVLRDVRTIIEDQELTRLHEIVRYYAKKGISFLYTGFHYEELNQLCDRMAIYSNGRILTYLKPGTPVTLQLKDYARHGDVPQKKHPMQGDPALEVRDLSGGSVRHLSFQVYPGECITVQDPQNRVFDDLIGMLLAERPAASGAVFVNGKPLSQTQAREIAIVREQPETSMIFEEMNYFDNLCITADHRLSAIWSSRRLRSGIRRDIERRVDAELFDTPVSKLTRRQRYDLVFSRVLLQRPRAVFLVQPFLGADMNMRAHIREQLAQLMDAGIAVVILAVNLAESLAFSSRLIRIEPDGNHSYEREHFDQVQNG